MKPTTTAVLALLRERGARGLSPNEARLHVGCDRLAARVLELREAGYPIETTRERHGHEGTHARYRLIDRPEPMRGVQADLFGATPNT